MATRKTGGLLLFELAIDFFGPFQSILSAAFLHFLSLNLQRNQALKQKSNPKHKKPHKKKLTT